MLTVNHSYGFFSFCSRLLEEIIFYFNKHHCLPEGLDLRQNLSWYKPHHRPHDDIFNDYFELRQDAIDYTHNIIFSNDDQYLDFKTLKYNELLPFVKRYFTPTQEIMRYVKDIETTYGLLDNYENICCLFYRGNDKVTETRLASYEEFVNYGKRVLENNNNTVFLIQSDEVEFIEKMKIEFPNHIILYNYIRAVHKCNSQVDILNMAHNTNYQYSKFYVAITYIMSKCKTIICNSGNCSLWIAFFRGSAEGMLQFKEGVWV